jgi:polygalacturonase
MLLKAAVLGLSTCASALNARSYSTHVPQYEEASSQTAPEPSGASSFPASLSVSSLALALGSVIASSAQVSYTQPTTNSPTIAPYPTKPNGADTSSTPLSTSTPGSCAPYWLENIQHQGLASFNPNPDNYTIFRNVKDFGARGDGVTDDTAAIQRAVTQGNRCGPSACESSTNTPAIVYFPEGTYLISSSIIDYYYTQV